MIGRSANLDAKIFKKEIKARDLSDIVRFGPGSGVSFPRYFDEIQESDICSPFD